MTGYVKADKKSMTVGDYEIYRGIYCSLCNSLGKNYSAFARLLLSYDFAFAAVLKLALSASSCQLTKKSCPFNPAKKCWCCDGRGEIDFCAHAVVIIAYYKILDNLHDKGFFKKLLSALIYPAISLMHKRAVKLAPDIEAILKENMAKQAECEKNPECSLDEAAHYSADALGRIFKLESSGEASEKLYNLGYMTGRFVYILDAADDLEKDIKTKNFNPFIKEFPSLDSEEEKKAFAERAEKALNLTQATLLEYKDSITLNRFAMITENILFSGLDSSARAVIDRYKGKEKDKKHITIR